MKGTRLLLAGCLVTTLAASSLLLSLAFIALHFLFWHRFHLGNFRHGVVFAAPFVCVVLTLGNYLHFWMRPALRSMAGSLLASLAIGSVFLFYASGWANDLIH